MIKNWENWFTIFFGVIAIIINFFVEPSKVVTGMWIFIAIVWCWGEMDVKKGASE